MTKDKKHGLKFRQKTVFSDISIILWIILLFFDLCVFLFKDDLHNCVDGCRLPKNGNGKKLCIEKILKNG